MLRAVKHMRSGHVCRTEEICIPVAVDAVALLKQYRSSNRRCCNKGALSARASRAYGAEAPKKKTLSTDLSLVAKKQEPYIPLRHAAI